MKARWSSAAVVTVAALSLTACGSSLSNGNDPSGTSAGAIRLGFLVPESGVYASIGVDVSNGLKLYLAQHGGKLGGRKVTLITLDEGSSPETGIPAANRLITQDKVAVATGIVNSATAAAVAPSFASAHVPVVSLAQLQSPNPYWWVDSYPNYATATAMADAMAAQHIRGGVYLAADDYSQGHAVLGAMSALLKERGVKVLGEVYTPFGSTLDFQPYLSTIKDSGARAVYAFYAGADAVHFVQQYHQFGLAAQAPLYASLAVTEGNLPAEGNAALGIITDSEYSPTIDSPDNKQFVTAYQAAYGALPTVYAEAEYAGAAVLNEALSRIKGAATGSKINAEIKALGSVTTPGGTWHFDAGHGPTQAYYLLKVGTVDGQLASQVLSDIGIYTSMGSKVSS